MGDTRGMLARLRKLERSRAVDDGLRQWVEAAFTGAIEQGRMCPVDGPVVRHCLLNWIDDGTARAGTAGWGLLR